MRRTDRRQGGREPPTVARQPRLPDSIASRRHRKASAGPLVARFDGVDGESVPDQDQRDPDRRTDRSPAGCAALPGASFGISQPRASTRKVGEAHAAPGRPGSDPIAVPARIFRSTADLGGLRKRWGSLIAPVTDPATGRATPSPMTRTPCPFPDRGLEARRPAARRTRIVNLFAASLATSPERVTSTPPG